MQKVFIEAVIDSKRFEVEIEMKCVENRFVIEVLEFD